MARPRSWEPGNRSPNREHRRAFDALGQDLAALVRQK